MRKLFPMMAVAVVFSCVSLVAFAAVEKTITGEGQCAKCSLKKSESCQNAIVVDEAGKKVTYFLVHDKVSKAFHKNLCTEVKKVKATGEVEEKDGKMMMTATKIELAD
jgi:Family of unknown function (DUF6370)